MMIRVAAFALALSLVGCSSDPTGTPDPGPPQDPTFTVADRAVWSGASIEISSDGFRQRGDDATLEVGGITLQLRRVNATTMVATAPVDRAGVWPATVHLDGMSYPVGTVTVAGFANATSLPSTAQIPHDVYVATVDHEGPVVLGGNLDGDLAVVHLRSGATTVIPDVIDPDDLRGPGMTPNRGVWLLRSKAGLERWGIDASPARIASVPGATMATRQVVELGSGGLLTTTSSDWYVWNRKASGDGYLPGVVGDRTLNDPYGLLLSTAANRIVPRVNTMPLGVPVFDLASGDVAFTSAMTAVADAAFSADGSQIVLVGDVGVEPTLSVIQADDGSVVASRAMESDPFAVAFDPSGRWIVVGITRVTDGATRPGVMVLNRNDLSVVAEMASPAAAPSCQGTGPRACILGVIAIEDHEVYIFHSNGPPRIWHFTLLDD